MIELDVGEQRLYAFFSLQIAQEGRHSGELACRSDEKSLFVLEYNETCHAVCRDSLDRPP
jgi:hypothetical protein